MSRLVWLVAGVAVGYLLLRRRRVPGWQPADTEYTAGDAYPVTLTNITVSSMWEPQSRYEALADGGMHVSWMQSDGTWTWAGL